MNIDLVKEFISLTDEINDLESAVKSLKQDRVELEESLLEFFANEGVQNMHVDGRTVYINRLLVTSIVGDLEEAINQFRAAGLGDLVKERVEINAQTLSRWARDLEEEDKPIPAAIQPLIKVFEKFSLRIRKGS